MIIASRYLADDLKSVIDPVIERNDYFGHPENVLLAMIPDDWKEIRELGVCCILKARNRQVVNGVRQFTVPKLNFDAEDCTTLIDWQTSAITEPPLTVELSHACLTGLVASHNVPVLSFPKFPVLHPVRRTSCKIGNGILSCCCGEKARHRFILTRLE